MDSKYKILVCGDVEGRFNDLFSRLDFINKKSGPFELLLCVGNFYGINNEELRAYKDGTKQVSVPTFILGPNKPEHADLYDNSEICSNLTFLGKRGIYLTGGLKIAYLSGVENKSAKTKQSYQFDKDDIVALRDSCLKGDINFRGIDLLITSVWPKGVTFLDAKNKINTVINESELVSWLAVQLRPRYHISGLEGIYYERPPYRNVKSPGEFNSETATRFIALARVNNPKKDKWLYALNITPINMMSVHKLYEKTTDETGCPYDREILKTAHKLAQNVQYFFKESCTDSKRKSEIDSGHRKRPRPVYDQSKCWFCFASPNVEKHLVISVGSKTYLALAKGGLVEEHFLILPIEHLQCVIMLPQPIRDEIRSFKQALISYFDTQGKVPIFFERNFKSTHLQVQVVPIPKQAAKGLDDIFKHKGIEHGIELSEVTLPNRIEQLLPHGIPYFWIELPNTTLYTRCRSDFPLQFGREVLATDAILNMPERTDWKDCKLPKENEQLIVERVRESFKTFDFTLNNLD